MVQFGTIIGSLSGLNAVK